MYVRTGVVYCPISSAVPFLLTDRAFLCSTHSGYSSLFLNERAIRLGSRDSYTVLTRRQLLSSREGIAQSKYSVGTHRELALQSCKRVYAVFPITVQIPQKHKLEYAAKTVTDKMSMLSVVKPRGIFLPR